MKILVLGATGLVGGETLRRALADKRVEQVIAPTRRSLPGHAKLLNPVAPELGLLLPDATHWAVDAVVCAIGTTIGKAGSQQAFRRVDYILPLAFAELAHRQGAQAFALVSSPGASLSIPLYYCRTKGELERDIGKISYTSLTIAHPGMIGGARDKLRFAEQGVHALARFLRPLLPRGLHINPAANIAKILVESVIAPEPGRHILTSKDLA